MLELYSQTFHYVWLSMIYAVGSLSTMFFFFYYLQEETVKKKYGGIIPKKPPLISKVTVSLTLSHSHTYHLISLKLLF